MTIDRFWTMPADPEAGHPEPYGINTWGIVDEEAGGVVAWAMSREAADDIAEALNAGDR